MQEENKDSTPRGRRDASCFSKCVLLPAMMSHGNVALVVGEVGGVLEELKEAVAEVAVASLLRDKGDEDLHEVVLVLDPMPEGVAVDRGVVGVTLAEHLAVVGAGSLKVEADTANEE